MQPRVWISQALMLAVYLVHPFSNSSCQVAGAAKSCDDSAKSCKPTVKDLGRTGNCSCFACEAGTKNEKTMCTNDKKQKAAFQGMLARPLPLDSHEKPKLITDPDPLGIPGAKPATATPIDRGDGIIQKKADAIQSATSGVTVPKKVDTPNTDTDKKKPKEPPLTEPNGRP